MILGNVKRQLLFLTYFAADSPLKERLENVIQENLQTKSKRTLRPFRFMGFVSV